jgi:3-oxoacyl-[acyl-carrier-protein] synthase II
MIAVSGTGAVLPTGDGAAALWSAAQAGRSAIGPLLHPGFHSRSIVAFGQVGEALTRACVQDIPVRLRRYCTPAVAWGIRAARQALAEAGIRPGEDGLRLGLYTSQGGYTHPSQPAYADLLDECRVDGELDRAALARRVLCSKALDPFLVLKSLTNGLLGLLSMSLGIRGEASAYMEGVSGNHAALCAAREALQSGRIDAALVVAAGSDLDPLALVALARSGALSRCGNDCFRPFDADAHGGIAGEGAVALLLRRAERQHAWLGLLGEAHAAASVAALATSEQRADLLLACGTGRADQDRRTSAVLARWPDASISCPNALTGRLGGAPTLLSILVALQAIGNRQVPPIAGLRRPVAALDFVRGQPRQRPIRRAVVVASDLNGYATSHTVLAP